MIATRNDIDAPNKGISIGYVAGLAGCLIAAGAFVATTFYLKVHHAAPIAFMGAALVYGLIIVGITTYTGGLARRIGKTGASAAAKRYRRRFTIAMVVYVVALVGALSGVTEYHIVGPAAYALAIAPALPLLAVIAIMGIYLREETDEFERAIQAEAALWASGGMLALATVWGFLELFELVPHIQTWWAFPIWAFLLGPGQLIARRRYR